MSVNDRKSFACVSLTVIVKDKPMEHPLKNAVKKIIICLCAAPLLTGCVAVGPDYKEPQMALPTTWDSSAADAGSQDEESLAVWWKKLNDPVLNNLIDMAVANNLDLKEAVSRVRQARYERNIAKADLYPSVDGSGSATKSGSSSDESDSSLYSASLDASWELDIFGGVRRSAESSVAAYQAQIEDLHDVLITLLSEVAINYIDLRTYQQQLLTTEHNIAIQQQSKDLTDSMVVSGLSDNLEQAQASYQLAGTKAELPTLKTSIRSSMNRLCALLGKTPGSLNGLLEKTAVIPVPEKSVTIGIPADMVRQRPDIRQAERNLAAETAKVGVAEADLYPHFYLSGSLGLQSTSSSSFFSDPTSLWSLGPSMSWSIFHSGSIRNNIKAQQEIQQQSLLQYQTTVIEAIEEVENNLTGFAAEQQKMEILTEAVASAKQAVEISTQQFSTGLGDFKDVLDAEQALLTYENQLNESRGSLASNFVELYKALGGGWQKIRPEKEEQLNENEG